MNRDIVRATVVAKDGAVWEFEGTGHMTVVNTVIPGEKGMKERPVRYVTIVVNLPVES